MTTQQQQSTSSTTNTTNNNSNNNTSPPSILESIHQLYVDNKLIGQSITLINTFQETIEGQVYAYDPLENTLILYESGDQHESSKRKTFRILHTKQCKFLSINRSGGMSGSGRALSSTPFATSEQLPGVNLEKLRERESVALAERKQKLGYGVTKEAQNIFDALSKTLPCRWKKNEIIVMDSVIVSPPYTNASGGDKFSRDRVQKVLTGELIKMAREEQQQTLLSQHNNSSNHNTIKK